MVRAAELYSKMLDIAVAATRDQGAVLYSACAPLQSLRRYGLPLELQQGNDLGERMAHALHLERSRYPGESVVLLGSDLPGIRARHIRHAHLLLGRADAVIGPARDGGYYLIGLAAHCKTAPAECFRGLAFSHDQVAREAMERFVSLGLTFAQTALLSDLDQAEDLHHARTAGEFPD